MTSRGACVRCATGSGMPSFACRSSARAIRAASTSARAAASVANSRPVKMGVATFPASHTASRAYHGPGRRSRKARQPATVPRRSPIASMSPRTIVFSSGMSSSGPWSDDATRAGGTSPGPYGRHNRSVRPPFSKLRIAAARSKALKPAPLSRDGGSASRRWRSACATSNPGPSSATATNTPRGVATTSTPIVRAGSRA